MCWAELRRLERLLANRKLALHVLEGEFDDGDTVVVDRNPAGAALVFRSGEAGAATESAPDVEAVAA